MFSSHITIIRLAVKNRPRFQFYLWRITRLSLR
uniref:Uncharacterized protein n=1 Tax=Anguilla anguilla TaxID=7936 RepID=A0A0E9U812_ANGAN